MSESVASRRAERAAALQAAYAMAVGGLSSDQALAAADETGSTGGPFTSQLLTALGGREDEWDARFEPCLAPGWPLARLAWTDRIVLRLACCELWELPEVPPRVTISEYVMLAKKFGSPESGRFVNGVLASVLPLSPKADWRPSATADLPDEPAVDEPEPADSEERVDAGSWVLRTEG